MVEVSQVTHGARKRIRSNPPKHKEKQDLAEVPNRARELLQRNVSWLMKERYGDEFPKFTPQVEELARRSTVGASTIARICDPEKYGVHTTTIETVEKLSMALRCEIHELLMERPPWFQPSGGPPNKSKSS